jgi:hypothetical protein
MIYRTHKKLQTGKRIIAAGSLIMPGDLTDKVIEVLVRREILTPLAPPPLATLPGWEKKAELLSKAGIPDAIRLLEADEVNLSKKTGERVEIIRDWKQEVIFWLTPPSKPEG